MKLILYSQSNWDYILKDVDIADIRMQNKQMTICENISGSAGVAHWLATRSINAGQPPGKVRFPNLPLVVVGEPD